MPRDETGQKGETISCQEDSSPELTASKSPATSTGPASSSGPQRVGAPLARAARRGRGTAGEGISNLGMGSEAVLMPCSTGLKSRMINESNGMKEPERK